MINLPEPKDETLKKFVKKEIFELDRYIKNFQAAYNLSFYMTVYE